MQRKGVRVSVVSSVRTSQPMVADDLRRQADNFLELADIAPEFTRRQTEPRSRNGTVRGTPAEGRAAVRSGSPEGMRRVFARHLAGTEAQAALASLGDLARREPVCLLCLEADPRLCHRALVAEAVAAGGGVAVSHLHPGAPDADLPRPA